MCVRPEISIFYIASKQILSDKKQLKLSHLKLHANVYIMIYVLDLYRYVYTGLINNGIWNLRVIACRKFLDHVLDNIKSHVMCTCITSVHVFGLYNTTISCREVKKSGQ